MLTLPKILPFRLPRWAQSAAMLIFLRIIRLEMVVEVSILSRQFDFSAVSIFTILDSLHLEVASWTQWIVEQKANLAMESLSSRALNVVLAYMVITFTIFFTIFITIFTLTLSKMTVALFSPDYLQEQAVATRDAAVPISHPSTIATPSSSASPVTISDQDSAPSQSLTISPTPSPIRQPRKPLSGDLEQTLSPSLRPTPLLPQGSTETKFKVLPSGMAIDMERRRARELTNSVYFRINLPEGITSSYHDFALGESSSYKLLSRVPDSVNPDDYRLWLRHPLVKGTFEFEYDFRTTHRVRDLFPEMESFRGNNFRIRKPNFFQTVIDILDSFLGVASERSVDDGEAVVGLSEVVVQCDADDDRWSATSGWTHMPAGDIVPRAAVHDSDLHSFSQDELIQAPSLRQFAFIGIPFQQQAHSILLPSEVNHLPFNELVCIRLENVQISFNDCRKLVDKCPRLERMVLTGSDIGKPNPDWDVQNGLFNDRYIGEKVQTSLKRLEVHGCTVDVWPLVRGLDFRPARQRIIVLNLSVEGADSFNTSNLAQVFKNVSEIYFPSNLLLHPNITCISSRLSGSSTSIKEYVESRT